MQYPVQSVPVNQMQIRGQYPIQPEPQLIQQSNSHSKEQSIKMQMGLPKEEKKKAEGHEPDDPTESELEEGRAVDSDGRAMCQMKDCENWSIGKCKYYGYCSTNGCRRYFCHLHAGTNKCMMGRSTCCHKKNLIAQRKHAAPAQGHFRTVATYAEATKPTPCKECYSHARRTSNICSFITLFFLLSPLWLILGFVINALC